MQLAQSLTVWMIRLSVAAYFAALAELFFTGRENRARFCWTFGCLACLAHIALAMHVFHHWNHAAAVADTARQTKEAIGLDWGGGVYINYLFAFVWSADALWWWASPQSRAARHRHFSTALHLFLAFIVLNATVVFEAGPVRWASLAACGAIALMWLRNRGK
jgi:hypothetical protein